MTTCPMTRSSPSTSRKLPKELSSRLTPDDNLWTAIEKFAVKDLDQIVVVSPDNPRRLLGMISHREVINAYNREILRRTLES